MAPAKPIMQKVLFPVPPIAVYELLMDSEKHSEFTGAAAAINPRVGGMFTAYDGYISGTNKQLVPGKKIVQEWQAADWPAGATSTATFELKKTKEGTLLLFTQTGVPSRFRQEISDGWYEHYWDKMKAALQQKKITRGSRETDDDYD